MVLLISLITINAKTDFRQSEAKVDTLKLSPNIGNA